MDNGTFTIIDDDESSLFSAATVDFVASQNSVELTIVQPRFNAKSDADGYIKINVGKQQLAELGALFTALSITEPGNYDDVDNESIVELLDGYGANGKELNTLADRFRQTAVFLSE